VRDSGVLVRVYNELVWTLLLAGDRNEADSVARRALTLFPELEAGVASFPPEVNALYERLREQLFGSLTLTSNPTDAAAFLADEYLGSTPLTIPLVHVGSHELIVRKEGHYQEATNLRIEPNQQTVVHVRLDGIDDFGPRGRIRTGLDAGPSYVFLGGGGGRTVFYLQEELSGTVGFSVGVLADLGITTSTYVELGLRFVRLGGQRELTSLGLTLEEPEIPRKVTFVAMNYLAMPVYVKVFPWKVRGWYLAAGPEVGVRVYSKNPIGGDYLVSANAGIGHEFTWSRRFTFIQLQFAMGLLRRTSSDRVTRELKLSTGVVF
jgi:hypothetical protein